jgi:neopullulanase
VVDGHARLTVPIDTPAWVREAVFYQIFPDRFAASDRVHKPGALEPWDSPPTSKGFKGGDLLGIVEHLAYLEDLGVTALYLNPIFTSASNHRYHTYDYLSVDPLLGGDDALRELLDAAHDRGMRVILDGVFNHAGRGFWPFHHVLENGGASPYREWFHLDDARLDAGRPLVAYPPEGAPRAALGYTAWWDLPALPKLNTADPEAREFLFGVAERWLRFGIDGWRLDVPEEIADESFWQEFRARCRAINPDAYLVGEIWHVAPEWLRGDRFDALMNYPLGEAILGFAGGSRLDMRIVAGHDQYRLSVRPTDGPALAARVIGLAQAYEPDVTAVQLNLLGSHDTPRLRTVLGDDVAAVRLAVLLQTTLPGAPCLYYGDEIGLVGANDPANRGAFPWDEARWDVELRATVRALLQLRATEPGLHHGQLRAVGAAGSAVAFERGVGAGRFVVAVNAGDSPTRLSLRFADAPGGAGGHLAAIELPGFARPAEARIVDGNAMIELDAQTGAVLRIV